jgi:hypothetical protein
VTFTRHVLRTAGILAVTRLVFDNVLSALPAYVFNCEQTLGAGRTCAVCAVRAR